MPDYENILQEFTWQFHDKIPEYPRTHTFLDYWQENIEAIIHKVEISHGRRTKSSARE